MKIINFTIKHKQGSGCGVTGFHAYKEQWQACLTLFGYHVFVYGRTVWTGEKVWGVIDIQFNMNKCHYEVFKWEEKT